MARIRTIKPEFFDDPKVGKLSPFARLAFLGLLTQADREGRIEDEPERLKVRVLPYDDVSMDGLLGELAQLGLVSRYTADEKGVIQVTNFEKHQRPHPKETPSLLPKPTVKRNGKPRINTASREKACTSRVDTGVLDTGVLDTGVLDTGDGASARGFTAFWETWPKEHRVNMKAAVEQWQRLSEDDRDVARAEVAWRVAHDPAWQSPREDGRWAIPHPFRYLRDRRFTDARSVAPATIQKPTSASPMPVYPAEDWCYHEPRCNSREYHAVRERDEVEA